MGCSPIIIEFQSWKVPGRCMEQSQVQGLAPPRPGAGRKPSCPLDNSPFLILPPTEESPARFPLKRYIKQKPCRAVFVSCAPCGHFHHCYLLNLSTVLPRSYDSSHFVGPEPGSKGLSNLPDSHTKEVPSLLRPNSLRHVTGTPTRLHPQALREAPLS